MPYSVESVAETVYVAVTLTPLTRDEIFAVLDVVRARVLVLPVAEVEVRS
jgi:hypothetical protein